MTTTEDPRTRHGARIVTDRHGAEHTVERHGRHCTCHGHPVTKLEGRNDR